MMLAEESYNIAITYPCFPRKSRKQKGIGACPNRTRSPSLLFPAFSQQTVVCYNYVIRCLHKHHLTISMQMKSTVFCKNHAKHGTFGPSVEIRTQGLLNPIQSEWLHSVRNGALFYAIAMLYGTSLPVCYSASVIRRRASISTS